MSLDLDIDECSNDSGGCDHGCNNTIGSFQCNCNDGYTLSDDRRTCLDVNECASQSHNCQQACINTLGRFRCGCYFGYELNADQRTCSGKLLHIPQI